MAGRGLAELWASGEPLSGGRGTARLCTIGDRRTVIKREIRGGFSRHFLPDLFLCRGPFEREQALVGDLKELGLSPAILEREFIRAGPLFSVYTLVEYSENSPSLVDLWKDGKLDSKALEVAGRGLGHLHKVRVMHGDLNAGNILIAPAESALFLDLRHSRRLERDPSPLSRRRNLARLARSLHKLSYTQDLAWPADVWGALARGYAEGWGAKEAWLEGWQVRCAKGFPLRRALWRKAAT